VLVAKRRKAERRWGVGICGRKCEGVILTPVYRDVLASEEQAALFDIYIEEV
jgi:hypothetical protein